MTIHFYVEGPSDRAVIEQLATPRARAAKVALNPYPLNGKQNVLLGGPKRALAVLRANPRDHVFLLVDLHPVARTGPSAWRHTTATQLRKCMAAGIPHALASRFHPHVMVHDLEALLLAHPAGLKRVLNTKDNCVVGSPEKVNHDHPPKFVVRELFGKYQPDRGYNETLHALTILKDADPDELALRCPDGFGLFWKELSVLLAPPA